MYRISLLLVILILSSCSHSKKSDLESMNINGKVKSIYEKTINSNPLLPETHKKMEFNKAGMLISTTFITPNISWQSQVINHYNSNGRISKQQYFDQDSLTSEQIYLHIGSAKDSILHYDSNGDLVAVGVIKYNKGGKAIEATLYDSLQSEFYYAEFSSYNKQGYLIENKIKSLDTIYDGNIHQYTYDTSGRMKSYFWLNKKREVIMKEYYQYKVDQFDNWIEKVLVTYDETVIARTHREIKYWEGKPVK